MNSYNLNTMPAYVVRPRHDQGSPDYTSLSTTNKQIYYQYHSGGTSYKNEKAEVVRKPQRTGSGTSDDGLKGSYGW